MSTAGQAPMDGQEEAMARGYDRLGALTHAAGKRGERHFDDSPGPVVRYIRGRGNARIAWSAAGAGAPTLVACSGWLSHLHADWYAPGIGEFWRALASRRRLVRYDRPGIGLADRDDHDFSLEAELDHLGRVIETTGESSVALLGRSLSGPTALAFTAHHPDKISHLVLFGTSVPVIGAADFPEGTNPALVDAIQRLVRADWGLAARSIAEIMLPGASPDLIAWYADYAQNAACGRVAADLIGSHGRIDVRDVLGSIAVPVLFLHRRDDRTVSLVAAQRTAEMIPGARLHVLEGSENLPFFGNRCEVIECINRFLNPIATGLTPREAEIVAAIAEGLSNRAIAKRMGRSEHTIARHIANAFLKLGVSNRSAAVTRARRDGLLG